METDAAPPKRQIFTVSELTEQIRDLLEEAYPFLWVAGEISNLHMPVSGHLYFTLKDPGAQINAVMFRGQNRHLKFQLEDGMAVIAMGRINVYEPKGTYQVIVEYVEPEGMGSLQLAFQQLKSKLAAEGLFDEKYKRPLPFLPQKIAVVTSPTGAVIRDMISVLTRRFPNLAVEIAPVKVQGEGAAEEIASALEMLNGRADADVLVLARGGGSLEDLQAFNSEVVARAIFSSHIPVVSAVGHETDFTIADFVADMRAPTPSAAAELMVPVKQELLGYIEAARAALKTALVQRLRLLSEQAGQIAQRLIHPGRRLADDRLGLDDRVNKMWAALTRALTDKRRELDITAKRLGHGSPEIMVHAYNVSLEHRGQSLRNQMQFYLQSTRGRFCALTASLHALSPLAVLERGYSVTRSLPGYSLVKGVEQVDVGQQVEVTLSRGAMVCRIERKTADGQANI